MMKIKKKICKIQDLEIYLTDKGYWLTTGGDNQEMLSSAEVISLANAILEAEGLGWMPYPENEHILNDGLYSVTWHYVDNPELKTITPDFWWDSSQNIWLAPVLMAWEESEVEREIEHEYRENIIVDAFCTIAKTE